MLLPILYIFALIISLMLIGTLAMIAILPVAFIILLFTKHKPKRKRI